MVLCGAQQGFYYAPTIEFGPNGAGIYLGVTTNGSSWTHLLLFTPSDLTIAANTWYDITLGYDGSQMIGIVSDGVTTITKQTPVNTAPYYNSSYNLEIGGISTSSYHYARYVQMDFSRCYIKSQNTLVWGNA